MSLWSDCQGSHRLVACAVRDFCGGARVRGGFKRIRHCLMCMADRHGWADSGLDLALHDSAVMLGLGYRYRNPL